jgi:hypothetical protein
MEEAAVRREVLFLLGDGRAHVSFDKTVAGFPAALRGKKPARAPHTPWQVLEHMRIAQWDILEYIRDPRHVSPAWPDGYWPDARPPSQGAWAKSVKAFRTDRQALRDLASEPSTDLLARVPYDPEGPTILQELMLVVDHTAYHLGQLLLLRRLLGAP